MTISPTDNIFAPNVLEGRVALITGGATGIGFTIAQTFAALGARVVIVSRKQEKLDAAVSAISEAGGVVSAIHTDVRSYEDVEAAVAHAESIHGGLDILISNAAGNFSVPTEKLSRLTTNMRRVFAQAASVVQRIHTLDHSQCLHRKHGGGTEDTVCKPTQ